MNLKFRKYHISLALVMSIIWAEAATVADSAKVQMNWNGEWRNYFMSTTNSGALKDWNALATGGRMGGVLQFTNGISLGAQAYLTMRVMGNDNSLADSTTGAGSRYEATLFDIAHPTRDISGFVGQLYIEYKHQQSAIRLGRQLFESPLINAQDGRMIPTLVEGAWISHREKKLDFGLGYIWAIAPRGTGGFSSVEGSFGALTQGKSVLGVPADYRGNIESHGIVVAKADFRPTDHFGFRAWNYLVDNVFNSLYLEADQSFVLGPNVGLKFSGQYIWQTRINNGGNDSLAKAYFDEDKSHTYGLKSELKWKEVWSFTLAGNLTTDRGRFLFPREWGREELYTFLRRDRSEGNGASKAIAVIASRKTGPWEMKMAWGRYWRTAPDDAVYNKYGVPTYDHVEIAAKRQFKGHFSRLNAEFILVYKYNPFGTDYAPQYIINRMNLLHLDIILNYRLGR